MFPIFIIDPSRSTDSLALLPSTMVPLVESRSRIKTSEPRTIEQ